MWYLKYSWRYIKHDLWMGLVWIGCAINYGDKVIFGFLLFFCIMMWIHIMLGNIKEGLRKDIEEMNKVLGDKVNNDE